MLNLRRILEHRAEHRSAHPGAVLLYCDGDHYVAIGDDADPVARALGCPMCVSTDATPVFRLQEADVPRVEDAFGDAGRRVVRIPEEERT